MCLAQPATTGCCSHRYGTTTKARTTATNVCYGTTTKLWHYHKGTYYSYKRTHAQMTLHASTGAGLLLNKLTKIKQRNKGDKNDHITIPWNWSARYVTGLPSTVEAKCNGYVVKLIHSLFHLLIHWGFHYQKPPWKTRNINKHVWCSSAFISKSKIKLHITSVLINWQIKGKLKTAVKI